MKYIVLYEYYSWTEGCGCCSDSSSEMHIFKEDRVNEVYETYCSTCPIIENEGQLREFVNEFDPYYNGFDVHPDTVYF